MRRPSRASCRCCRRRWCSCGTHARTRRSRWRTTKRWAMVTAAGCRSRSRDGPRPRCAGSSAEQTNIARRILLRLISFGEGRSDTRRQQSRAQLRSAGDDAAVFAFVLQTMVEDRLLTVDDDVAGEPRVDLSHEVLITAWPELRAVARRAPRGRATPAAARGQGWRLDRAWAGRRETCSTPWSWPTRRSGVPAMLRVSWDHRQSSAPLWQRASA